jgi:hypothetical protein
MQGIYFFSHIHPANLMAAVRFRWERSSDRSYCHKNVGMDGSPFQNSKRTITNLIKPLKQCKKLSIIYSSSLFKNSDGNGKENTFCLSRKYLSFTCGGRHNGKKGCRLADRG